jgi:GNAT superfamily N-acetyltransferase
MNIAEGEPTTIRRAGPDDMAFIVHAWLEGYWADCPCSLVMPKAEWSKRWHTVIENILADERSVTLVACSPDSDTFLYGFICARPPDVLHWLYVKQAFRGNGFASVLMYKAGIIYGHVRTSHWSAAAQRMQEVAYDPEYPDQSLAYDPRLIKEYA